MENIASSISLPNDLEAKIKKLAKELGKSKNSLIQEALRQYVDRQELLEIEKKMQAKARVLGIESDEDVVDLIHEMRQSQQK